jgi:hypothetical protein
MSGSSIFSSGSGDASAVVVVNDTHNQTLDVLIEKLKYEFNKPGEYGYQIGVDPAVDEKDKTVDADTTILHKIDIVLSVLQHTTDNTEETQDALIKVHGIQLTYKIHGEISKSDMEYMNDVFRKYRHKQSVDKNTLDILKRQFEQFNI